MPEDEFLCPPQAPPRCPAEFHLSDESIERLVERIVAGLAPAIAASVTRGVDAALTDEKAAQVFEVWWKVVQREAKLRAGGFLLGGLTAAVKKVLWVIVFVVGMYFAFGWAGLKAAWTALNS